MNRTRTIRGLIIITTSETEETRANERQLSSYTVTLWTVTYITPLTRGNEKMLFFLCTCTELSIFSSTFLFTQICWQAATFHFSVPTKGPFAHRGEIPPAPRTSRSCQTYRQNIWTPSLASTAAASITHLEPVYVGEDRTGLPWEDKHGSCFFQECLHLIGQWVSWSGCWGRALFGNLC